MDVKGSNVSFFLIITTTPPHVLLEIHASGGDYLPSPSKSSINSLGKEAWSFVACFKFLKHLLFNGVKYELTNEPVLGVDQKMIEYD